MNPKAAYYAWLAALSGLLVYEFYALGTGHMTLSRAVWVAESGAYGTFVPFAAGFLCGHFFSYSWKVFAAFAFAFLGGALFWHVVYR